MMRAMAITMGCLAMACVAVADAETYSWTDAQGTMHFTEDLGAVPAKLRKKVKKLGGDEPASIPAAKPESQTSSAKVPAVAPAGKGEPQSTEAYAGKTYDQWKQDLADREAAMRGVRQRIDEIAGQLKGGSVSFDSQQKLIDEHTALVKRFKEIRADYDRQVETIRKAGLQVNLK